MRDEYNREINYMRISVTDRCNFRCRYCMPEGCEKVEMSQILSYEQMAKVCEAAAHLGISKFKITGGEPLVRLGIVDFIRELNRIEGIDEVTMTSNGALLVDNLQGLSEAGLKAVNISLDSLRHDRFECVTGGGSLDAVLAGLDAAIASGMKVKVNTVLQEGFNDDEILDFCEMAFEKGIPVRFIELMPVGFGGRLKGVSNEHVLTLLKDSYSDVIPDDYKRGNGPAVYYKVNGNKGYIGFISALHSVFCSQCNRIRLTSQGLIKSCLCYEDSVDLKPYLNEKKEVIAGYIKEAIMNKPAQHCFNSDGSVVEKRAMSQIGG